MNSKSTSNALRTAVNKIPYKELARKYSWISLTFKRAGTGAYFQVQGIPFGAFGSLTIRDSSIVLGFIAASFNLDKVTS